MKFIQEHDAENRDGQRRDEFASSRDRCPSPCRRRIRPAISTAACNLPGTPLVARRATMTKEDEHAGDDELENDAVEVEGPESAVTLIHGEMRQVVLDVARHPARHSSRHHSAMHNPV
jgi:hypothetical protein